MSHSTVTVVVPHASSPQQAVALAEELLAPHSEELTTPRIRLVDADDTQQALNTATVPQLKGKSLDVINSDPADRALMASAVGEYMNGDPDSGRWHEGQYAYLSQYNPDGRWDWYLVGGRWQGFYQLKPDVPASAFLLGEPGAFGSDPAVELTGRADVVRKRDVDIDAARTLAGAEAESLYDTFEEATQGLTPPPSWERTVASLVHDHIVELQQSVQHDESSANRQGTGGSTVLEKQGTSAIPPLPDDLEGMSDFEAEEWAYPAFTALSKRDALGGPRLRAKISQASADFNSDPWVQAVAQSNLRPLFDSVHAKFEVGTGGRAAVVDRARRMALLTHSVLTEDGWHERGRMGMFGVSDNEVSEGAWVDQFDKLFSAVPDDAWLVLVDIHS